MTATADSPPVAAYRLFDVEVACRRRLSPAFTRFTLTGEDLHAFADNGFDQRIKLVLPLPRIGIMLPRGDDWFTTWRQLPDARRNPIRTYTVRAVRQRAREIDVDVVLHGEAGPASRWATHAQPGDRLAVLGPNVDFPGDHGGLEFDVSATARRLLLAGDETAVPAVASILERLPATARGEALLEVPDAADVLELRAPAGVTVTWIARAGASQGELLVPAVREAAVRLISLTPPVDDEVGAPDDGTDLVWDVPQPAAASAATTQGVSFYAWIAGEAGVVTTVRRHLVRDLGIDRRSVAFMGYWKLGRPEG